MIKLYETQSYLTECDATVIESFEKDGKYYIRLDQSIFFPEEGGQYADTGILKVISDASEESNGAKSVELVNGSIKRSIEDEITYEVSESIAVGSKVHGILNWQQRFDRMQNHSGEHVLTGLVHGKYGYNNVGFHLSDEGFVTLDFDGSLSYEDAIEMEREANRVIYKNLPIKDSYPTKEELSSIDYRSKIELEGQVRLITVGDKDNLVDVCACCAPHVRTTSEIGIIKVISVIKWKKGVQISILCGRRALEYIEAEHDQLMLVARNLSTSPENVWNVVKSHMEEVAVLKGKLSETIGRHLMEQIPLLDGDMPGFIFTENELDTATMKKVYNAIMDSRDQGCFGIFSGDDDKGYRFNAGIINKDARKLATLLREKLNAKGGGSEEMIQGQVMASKEEILNACK